MDTRQADIFTSAVNSMAATFKRPLLYGPDNRPLAPSNQYTYGRRAASQGGSLKGWRPARLYSGQQETLEREAIAARAIDLGQSDPHAAGILETFSTTVIGAGLTPHPQLDPDVLGFTKTQVNTLAVQEKAAYSTWSLFADAGGRMTAGMVSFLIERNLVQFGEFILLVHMIDDPTRPYSLAVQVIHPMRLKTPTDLISQGKIRDGIEMDAYGRPTHYWIKKASPGLTTTADTSNNFIRIATRKAHRWRVIHGFVVNDPEQIRGVSFFAPALKYFRDFNDLLDAELVSNVVTAAFSLFIEAAGATDPMDIANNMSGWSEAGTNPDGETETTRYQEMVPGSIMYGNAGEKPQSIAAARPGVTFEPFTRLIKKTLATSANIPLPVLFKDLDGISFAGFRSAMLEAWRVFSYRRVIHGHLYGQKLYTMLQEEAWLRGHLTIPNNDFYGKMHQLTRVKWVGAPKGDIEPIKAAKADILEIDAHLKTREQAIIERGGEARTTFDRLEDERTDLIKRKLQPDESVQPVDAAEPGESAAGQGETAHESGTDYGGLKLKADYYGVAVRAGAITPQITDEELFRSDAGLPEISDPVKDAWEEDGNVRRPITLKAGDAFDAAMDEIVRRARKDDDANADQ